MLITSQKVKSHDSVNIKSDKVSVLPCRHWALPCPSLILSCWRLSPEQKTTPRIVPRVWSRTGRKPRNQHVYKLAGSFTIIAGVRVPGADTRMNMKETYEDGLSVLVVSLCWRHWKSGGHNSVTLTVYLNVRTRYDTDSAEFHICPTCFCSLHSSCVSSGCLDSACEDKHTQRWRGTSDRKQHWLAQGRCDEQEENGTRRK